MAERSFAALRMTFVCTAFAENTCQTLACRTLAGLLRYWHSSAIAPLGANRPEKVCRGSESIVPFLFFPQGACHEPFLAHRPILFTSSIPRRLCRVRRLPSGKHLVGTASAQAQAATTGKPKIRLVFCETSNNHPIWPNVGYDFDARRKQLVDVLTSGCPQIDLRPTKVMEGTTNIAETLKDDSEVQGYIICLQGLGWSNDVGRLCSTGKPTLLVDNLFGGSGLLLARLPQVMKSGKPVDWVSLVERSGYRRLGPPVRALVPGEERRRDCLRAPRRAA